MSSKHSVLSLLDEKQRRLYAGPESLKLGYGGDRKVAEFLGMDPQLFPACQPQGDCCQLRPRPERTDAAHRYGSDSRAPQSRW